MNTLVNSTPRATHELRFHAASNEGAAYTFPCDRRGHVDMDGLDDRARNDYLFARAVIKLRRECLASEVVRAG